MHLFVIIFLLTFFNKQRSLHEIKIILKQKRSCYRVTYLNILSILIFGQIHRPLNNSDIYYTHILE